ncbi:MAG TPA: hypothetical protein VG897_01835 [Terriglobales bacterium]|nr:hypothetical protein [Terriglobales bacterium]
MADNKQDSDVQPPKNEHGQGFPDRPAGEKSRYDPEEEIPDPDQVEKDIDEAEKAYKDRKAS